MSSTYNKTRIAPTASGFLHAGNIYSFMLTASLAKQTGAKILLRIDDLDHQRVRKDYLDDIFVTLAFMDIAWHEGPTTPEEFQQHYSQQTRKPLYEEALNKLADLNAVYACTCSRSTVKQDNPDGEYPGTCRNKNFSLHEPGACWRLKTETNYAITVNQLQDGPVITVLPPRMKDFIVRKKDGNASYQLASVIDDIHYGVDLIIRGQDLWESTLAQLYLSQILNNSFSTSTFHHHPLLTQNGIKLSKSAGAGSIKHLREQGFSPADIRSLIDRMLNQQ